MKYLKSYNENKSELTVVEIIKDLDGYKKRYYLLFKGEELRDCFLNDPSLTLNSIDVKYISMKCNIEELLK